MSYSTAPRRWRLQFSLKSLLALTTLVALSIVAWQKFFYVHPAHRVSLYEKAPYTLGQSIQVGPNLIGMKLLTRNDRDGSLISTNGRGKLIKNAKPQNAAELIQCGPWLDVVQLELDVPEEQLDLLEIRIFDHRTRQPIGENNPRFGWRAVSRNTIQIYGIGQPIPDLLDIWFRLFSYGPDDVSVSLAPTAGAECQLPNGGMLKVHSVREGNWGGASNKEYDYFLGNEGSTFLLKANKSADSTTNQLHWIFAVRTSGERIAEDLPVSAPQPYSPIQRLHSLSPSAEIKQFEIRPYGPRHNFFYQAVPLPKISGKPFQKPPTVTLKVDGQETSRDFTELAPLKFSAETHRGDWVGGSMARSNHADIIRRDKIENLDTQHTLIFRSHGTSLSPTASFLPARTNQPGPTTTRGLAGGGSRAVWFEIRNLPLSELKEVKFQFPPPAPRPNPAPR